MVFWKNLLWTVPDDDKSHNWHVMIKATTLLPLMWSQVVILHRIMIDFYTEYEWVRSRAINRFSPPPALLAIMTVCAGWATRADVRGLCLRRLCGPRIACFGLECELTHTHTHTRTHAHTEKTKKRSRLPLILHILSSLNSTPQPELSLPSKLPSVTAYVCIYLSVCILAAVTTPSWRPARRKAKALS